MTDRLRQGTRRKAVPARARVSVCIESGSGSSPLEPEPAAECYGGWRLGRVRRTSPPASDARPRQSPTPISPIRFLPGSLTRISRLKISNPDLLPGSLTRISQILFLTLANISLPVRCGEMEASNVHGRGVAFTHGKHREQGFGARGALHSEKDKTTKRRSLVYYRKHVPTGVWPETQQESTGAAPTGSEVGTETSRRCNFQGRAAPTPGNPRGSAHTPPPIATAQRHITPSL